MDEDLVALQFRTLANVIANAMTTHGLPDMHGNDLDTLIHGVVYAVWTHLKREEGIIMPEGVGGCP